MNDKILDVYALAKLYLSSISAKRMNYAYFNIDSNVIVLSNSTTGKKGNEHGDRLTNHAVGELSFHMMWFHDNGAFINEMKRLLGIPEGVYYGIHIPRLMALWNNNDPADLLLSTDVQCKSIIMTPKGVKYDPLKHLIGTRVEDFHVLSQLLFWYNYARQVGDDKHRTVYNHNSVNIESLINRDDQVYRILIKSDNFAEPAIGLFANTDMYSIMFDGLSIPSYKQFLGKVKKPYTLAAYLWTDDGSSIQAMYQYTDDFVTVRSIRPNVRLIPLRLDIELDKNLLNS